MKQHTGHSYADYTAFMQLHRETVWGVCWRFAHGDRECCRDMVQEVYMALWLKFGQLRSDSNEWQQRAWVRKTSRSVLVDLYRRQEPELERLDGTAADTIAEPEADETFEELMEHLGSVERQLVQLRLEGYEAEAIADKLGIEPNTVYQRFNRIVKKLRKAYGR